MLSVLALSTLIALGRDPQLVALARVFVKGEKDQYAVESHLQIESQPVGLATWIPEDVDLSYKFTVEVTEMLPDGVARIHYQRPLLTRVFGETFERPATTRVEKENVNLDLTVSPANEIINHADHLDRTAKWTAGGGSSQEEVGEFVEQFIDELYRLAAYTGSMDNALDFAPKLPLGKIAVGDAWKRTVGYQPQRLQGKSAKMAVQRLDYTYTYLGMVDVAGRKVVRVHGKLTLDTDLAAFANQASPGESNLKELPLKLNADVDFDLDPRNYRTIAATAKAEGSFKVVLTESPDEPIRNVRMKGQTSMRLVGTATVSEPR